jgi:hypothetical protein
VHGLDQCRCFLNQFPLRGCRQRNAEKLLHPFQPVSTADVEEINALNSSLQSKKCV